jgi:L-ribulokinase
VLRVFSYQKRQRRMAKYALGLDYGTESVRALAVNCDSGHEASIAVRNYEHRVITERLPNSSEILPIDFALQHPQDFLDAGTAAIAEALMQVPASTIIGIGIDFTACTILPIKRDGTPLMQLEQQFRANPHAWVKLWKHRAAHSKSGTLLPYFLLGSVRLCIFAPLQEI